MQQKGTVALCVESLPWLTEHMLCAECPDNGKAALILHLIYLNLYLNLQYSYAALPTPPFPSVNANLFLKYY